MATPSIEIDHHSLRCLDPIEKMNCVYCGYFNGLIAYVQETGVRTVPYWCPTEHPRKLKAIHSCRHTFV